MTKEEKQVLEIVGTKISIETLSYSLNIPLGVIFSILNRNNIKPCQQCDTW